VEIIEKRIAELTPYKNNPRKNDQAVDAVAASIKAFGFKVPIVIDRDGVIVCGHTRAKAAKKLKLESVPCVVADDLTEEEIKAFRLADNKVGELAEWDLPALDLELADIDFDMSQFGLDLLAEEAPTESKTDNEKSVDINEEYAVLVSCDTEQELQRTYETLQKEGYQCRIFAL
jgi:ParB-like chromosome segregation protein Spo0J